MRQGQNICFVPPRGTGWGSRVRGLTHPGTTPSPLSGWGWMTENTHLSADQELLIAVNAGALRRRELLFELVRIVFEHEYAAGRILERGFQNLLGEVGLVLIG